MSRHSRMTMPPASLTFAGLTVLGVTCQSLGRVTVTPHVDVVDRFGARLVDVAAGEVWRLMTAPFVSAAGWPHALLNIAGGFLVVWPLERRRGTRTVVVVLVASAAAAFASGVWGHGAHWLSAGGSGLVLGCAGFLTARWSTTGPHGRAGVGLVLMATFVLPVVAGALGHAPRGSLPAHAGGFLAGLGVGLASAHGLARSAAVAVTCIAALATLPRLVPLLPDRASVLPCDTRSTSSSRPGTATRLLFRSDSDDFSVRGIGPRGEPGPAHPFSPERRGRMPWYGYSGAVYEVIDRDGGCVMRVRATRATSTVRITTSPGEGSHT